jgi:hypothetical protein
MCVKGKKGQNKASLNIRMDVPEYVFHLTCKRMFNPYDGPNMNKIRKKITKLVVQNLPQILGNVSNLKMFFKVH